jgi:hypothetical protein
MGESDQIRRHQARIIGLSNRANNRKCDDEPGEFARRSRLVPRQSRRDLGEKCGLRRFVELRNGNRTVPVRPADATLRQREDAARA